MSISYSPLLRGRGPQKVVTDFLKDTLHVTSFPSLPLLLRDFFFSESGDGSVTYALKDTLHVSSFPSLPLLLTESYSSERGDGPVTYVLNQTLLVSSTPLYLRARESFSSKGGRGDRPTYGLKKTISVSSPHSSLPFHLKESFFRKDGLVTYDLKDRKSVV